MLLGTAFQEPQQHRINGLARALENSSAVSRESSQVLWTLTSSQLECRHSPEPTASSTTQRVLPGLWCVKYQTLAEPSRMFREPAKACQQGRSYSCGPSSSHNTEKLTGSSCSPSSSFRIWSIPLRPLHTCPASPVQKIATSRNSPYSECGCSRNSNATRREKMSQWPWGTSLGWGDAPGRQVGCVGAGPRAGRQPHYSGVGWRMRTLVS